MEPHCQSVLTPPPPLCQAVTQLSLDALEPLSQFLREGGRVYSCVCAHACFFASVHGCLRRGSELRSLGACVFFHLCLLNKSSSCNTKAPRSVN